MTGFQRLALCAAIVGAVVLIPHLPALAQAVDTTTAPDFASGTCSLYPKLKLGAFAIGLIALVAGILGLRIGGEDFSPILRRVSYVMFGLVVIAAAGWIVAQALGSSQTCTANATPTSFLMDLTRSFLG